MHSLAKPVSFNDNSEALGGDGGLGPHAWQNTHDPFSSEPPIGGQSSSNMNGGINNGEV